MRLLSSLRAEGWLSTVRPSTTSTSLTSAALAMTLEESRSHGRSATSIELPILFPTACSRSSALPVRRANARRIQWLFDNHVYPIVYPLPRRARMAEDNRTVIRLTAEWAGRSPRVTAATEG